MITPSITNSEPLISLVYVSAGIRVFSEEEINDILAQSYRNNGANGVTGMLLYRDGNFLQVLEGPDAAVESTLQRIRVDTRHRGIVVLKKTKIEDRSFSDWAMAFKKLHSEDIKEMDGYSPFMELSFDSEGFKKRPEFGCRMLLQFKNKMR